MFIYFMVCGQRWCVLWSLVVYSLGLTVHGCVFCGLWRHNALWSLFTLQSLEGSVGNQGLFTLPSAAVDSVARSMENDISVVTYDLVRDDLLCGLSPVFAVYSVVISGVLWSLW